MDINNINRVNRDISEFKKANQDNPFGNNIKGEDRKDLHEACRGFESIFLDAMLKSMRKTIPEDKLFGDGNGMDIYTSMHDQYLAQNISENGSGIGLEDFFYKQIAKVKQNHESQERIQIQFPIL